MLVKLISGLFPIKESISSSYGPLRTGPFPVLAASSRLFLKSFVRFLYLFSTDFPLTEIPFVVESSLAI